MSALLIGTVVCGLLSLILTKPYSIKANKQLVLVVYMRERYSGKELLFEQMFSKWTLACKSFNEFRAFVASLTDLT